MTAFDLTFSKQYFVEAQGRFLKSRKTTRVSLIRTPFVLLFAAVIFLPLVLSTVMTGDVVTNVASGRFLTGACTAGMFCLLLVVAYFYVAASSARRFQNSPYRNAGFRVQLSEDGYNESSSISSVQLRWAAFTAACRFEDGFLLIQGPGAFNWLPFDSVTAGSIDEAEELIRQNIAQYRNV